MQEDVGDGKEDGDEEEGESDEDLQNQLYHGQSERSLWFCQPSVLVILAVCLMTIIV